ncbi:MAG: TMEM165/GDT1 family protein [Nevskia sp.]|nr:TMEM165/GDT1 family protein [Nevskia sp.]
MFEAFGISTLVVAVGEIGDKTQLLALLLACRFRKPVPILLGILAATIANHGVAGFFGAWIRGQFTPDTLRWLVGVTFLAIAAWALVPDKLEDEAPKPVGRYGVFLLTLVAFFLAEIGDKTQLATVALAARFDSLLAVVCGTTLGMMIADAPAVLLAERLTQKLSFKLIRFIAAGLFAALGIAALLSTAF